MSSLLFAEMRVEIDDAAGLAGGREESTQAGLQRTRDVEDTLPAERARAHGDLGISRE